MLNKLSCKVLAALLFCAASSVTYGAFVVSLDRNAGTLTLDGSVGEGAEADPVYTPTWGGGVSFWLEFGSDDYSGSFPSVNNATDTSATFGTMTSQSSALYTNDGAGLTLRVDWATKDETSGVLTFNNTQFNISSWSSTDLDRAEGYFDTENFYVRSYFDNLDDSDFTLEVVPEPTTYALSLGAAAALLALYRRRS